MPADVNLIVASDEADAPSLYVSWTPIVIGALVATALSSIMLAFAVSVGLGVSSAAPTWRDTSASLALLSGLYLIIQAVISFGVGGYIAGRARTGVVATLDSDATERRDGLHGLAAWALAVVLGAALAALIGSAVLPRSNTALVTPSRTSAAETLLGIDLDRMFRPVRRPANIDLAEARAEAGRILLTTSGHSGITAEDRAYLIQIVTNTTGLAGPDAERRADTAIVNAKTAIARSRRSAVIVAFSVATALLIGAAVAWAAASVGGRHRDGEPLPDWMNSGMTARKRGMP
jgi:hypothetical protein